MGRLNEIAQALEFAGIDFKIEGGSDRENPWITIGPIELRRVPDVVRLPKPTPVEALEGSVYRKGNEKEAKN